MFHQQEEGRRFERMLTDSWQGCVPGSVAEGLAGHSVGLPWPWGDLMVVSHSGHS